MGYVTREGFVHEGPKEEIRSPLAGYDMQAKQVIYP